jgi:hypothetical protein
MVVQDSEEGNDSIHAAEGLQGDFWLPGGWRPSWALQVQREPLPHLDDADQGGGGGEGRGGAVEERACSWLKQQEEVEAKQEGEEDSITVTSGEDRHWLLHRGRQQP